MYRLFCFFKLFPMVGKGLLLYKSLPAKGMVMRPSYNLMNLDVMPVCDAHAREAGGVHHHQPPSRHNIGDKTLLQGRWRPSYCYILSPRTSAYDLGKYPQ